MKWRILPIFWQALKRVAMGLGFIVLLNFFIALFILPMLFTKPDATPSLPSEFVLFMEFKDELREMPSVPSFSDPFAANKPTVREMVNALDHAAADDRVQGIVARMYDGSFSMAHVAELRAALKRFRDTGKFAHIYSASYGEGGGGLGRYYLASAFDEIWMQPMGVVSIAGVQADVPFFRETLDKIGVKPEFFKRKEYKTAYESITDRQMSANNRKMLNDIVNSIKNEILATVPEEREISVSEFEALVDKGLLTAPEAKAAGLVTHVDYGDILLENIAEATTGERDLEGLKLVNFDGYINITRKNSSSLINAAKPKVALVYAVGAVMPTSEGGGLAAEGVAAADKIVPAIFAATDDEKVSAIVVRIDSPGGSPSASESILHALERAQKKGKPVIVSMGATAASGGYWIAASADKIYALPTTLTGSIGVVGGKFALDGAADKIGVNFDTVKWGQNSGIWSMTDSFSKSEAARFNAMLDHVYDGFITRVANGRGMEKAAVDKVAGGRVWTGKQAVEVGLVDEIGGLENALDYAATLAGKENRDDLNVVIYPKPLTALEQLVRFLETQAAIGQTVQSYAPFFEAAAPVANAVAVSKNPQNYMVYEPLTVQ